MRADHDRSAFSVRGCFVPYVFRIERNLQHNSRNGHVLNASAFSAGHIDIGQNQSNTTPARTLNTESASRALPASMTVNPLIAKKSPD